MGRVSPEIENPVPETFACEIVTEDPPVFVNTSHKLAVFPTCTLPKARLAGFALSVPGGGPEIATSSPSRLAFPRAEPIGCLPTASFQYREAGCRPILSK
jgi:hypothetical protein